MEDHMLDTEDTISLSDLHIEDTDSHEVAKLNKTSASSSSSSSSSSSPTSFDQDFLGFFSEEWSHDTSYTTSPENIIFCGKVVSLKPHVSRNMKTQKISRITSPLFRSNSDSFRFMGSKNGSRPSTPRSKSLPKKLPSYTYKSKWQVFMFGFGSGKFPTTMDVSDIKSRQLRRKSTAAMPQWIDDGKAEIVGRRSGKKGWWRLVDALGCSGGFERDSTTW